VWASAKGQLGRLLGLTVLLLAVVAAPLAVWGGLTTAALVNEQWALGAVVGILGFVAALVGTVVLVTRTLLATPALMLEQASVAESLRRAWRLTRGCFWRVFGIYLLTSLLVGIVAGAITNGAALVLQVTATDPAALLVSPTYLVGSALAQIVATTLTTPFSAGVTALLYIDVRMRSEGLDIELARAAEQAA
jgi:membrane-anchored glycerophosphoryl diester phosphodiesterase (GDPDase)